MPLNEKIHLHVIIATVRFLEYKSFTSFIDFVSNSFGGSLHIGNSFNTVFTDWHQERVMSHGNDEHIIRRINIFFETHMPIFLHIFFDTLKSSEQNMVVFSVSAHLENQICFFNCQLSVLSVLYLLLYFCYVSAFANLPLWTFHNQLYGHSAFISFSL